MLPSTRTGSRKSLNASRSAMAAASGGGAAAAAPAAALVWFRNDLRLGDHEPLFTAASQLQGQAQGGALLLPFYCLDERELVAPEGSRLGLPELGPHRLRQAPPSQCFLPTTTVVPIVDRPLLPPVLQARPGGQRQPAGRATPARQRPAVGTGPT